MRSCLLAFGALMVVGVPSASAQDLCGKAPLPSDPAISRGVAEAIEAFKFSSQSGAAFGHLAVERFHGIAKDSSPAEAHAVAAALLHAECADVTQNEDPARLPWQSKDRLVELSKLIPDFNEAQALLDRIRALESQR
jgi:hypothetical protein